MHPVSMKPSSVIPAARSGTWSGAPLRGTVSKGALKRNIAIEQIWMESEMQTPFRANTPGKPSERDRREMEEAVAAYHFAVRRAAERGRRAQDDREHGEQLEGREARYKRR